jgi:hypothetical protein
MNAVRSIIDGRRRELQALCLRCNVRQLDLFGSATTDHFDPAHSDLDMLVVFADMLPGDYADAYFTLKQGLEDLFGRDVDLVTASTLENPHFRREVESTKHSLFAAA